MTRTWPRSTLRLIIELLLNPRAQNSILKSQLSIHLSNVSDSPKWLAESRSAVVDNDDGWWNFIFPAFSHRIVTSTLEFATSCQPSTAVSFSTKPNSTFLLFDRSSPHSKRLLLSESNPPQNQTHHNHFALRRCRRRRRPRQPPIRLYRRRIVRNRRRPQLRLQAPPDAPSLHQGIRRAGSRTGTTRRLSLDPTTTAGTTPHPTGAKVHPRTQSQQPQPQPRPQQ